MDQTPLSPPLLPGPRPVAADGIEVLQILKTLWRRRLVIALVTLALTVIGYWFINRITPRYAAETVLLLDVSAADSTNEVDEIVNGLSKDEALINSQIDIMSSRNIAERVVDLLRLTSYPEFQTVMARLYPRPSISDHILAYLPLSVRGLFDTQATQPPPAPENLRAVVVDYVLNKLEVENDGELYTVQLRYEADDAELAPRIANAFAELYLTTRLEYKQDINGKRAKWLGTKLDELRQRVGAADRAVQEFREQNGSGRCPREFADQ